MRELKNFAQNGANTHTLKTVNRVFRKNDNEFDPSPLKLAHLAYAALQHEGVKQEKYDASLSCEHDPGIVFDAQHVYDVREDFFGNAETLNNTIVCEQHANMLIHNKYYCDHKGCR